LNPFKEKPKSIEKSLQNWKQLYPKSYNKREVDPYTKTRIILMNGTEFEANWFSHQFARHTDDNDLRRALALTREVEKQQQLKISLLKPLNETVLEHTIGYEQLAVDLTAELAKRELDCNVKTALDFALLEDFDHLYRYANLLEMEQGVAAEWLVGRYTEIMPGRPTIAHHRYPMDNVRRSIDAKNSDVQTVLNTMIITAAEQQTMNYYMNVTNFACTDMGRKLYQEIALVEEEHVTHYESLMDPNATWLEMLLWHEYCECYLYWSCYMTETDPYVKELWEENLEMEIAHLHKAAELLKKYECKDWQEVIKDGEFPAPISLHENIDYVRKILGDTVQYTSVKDGYMRVKELPSDADFFRFQSIINPTTQIVPSHCVIETFISKRRADYRYQIAPSPIPELRNRREDNTSVGREPGAAPSTGFYCNKD
jgi:ferritin-like protein